MKERVKGQWAIGIGINRCSDVCVCVLGRYLIRDKVRKDWDRVGYW